uniref:Lipocalin/cytosolic fatty-acid binding domain-containing protein n=1 Tax=Graphocephala atropunctata TaxID=36148 RepID=A0A1B6LP07_9HEMI
MKSILVLASLFWLSHGDLGPCRPIFPVHADICKWPGQMYLNMYTQDLGQTCSWVNRYLNYTGDGQIVFAEQYRRLVNGNPVNTVVNAQYVSKGHYIYSAMRGEKLTVLRAYFLLFDPPNIDIHYVCTEDPEFSQCKGTGSILVESMYPDLPEIYRERVNRVLIQNGFNTSELIKINNCNCSNIPEHFGPGKCPNANAKKYA